MNHSKQSLRLYQRIEDAFADSSGRIPPAVLEKLVDLGQTRLAALSRLSEGQFQQLVLLGQLQEHTVRELKALTESLLSM